MKKTIILTFQLFLLFTIYQNIAGHYCKPTEGWMYAKCTDCQSCTGVEGCASGLCAINVNCENWNTVCGQNPNPNVTHNCPSYQHWDNTSNACVNSFGWCYDVSNYNLSKPGFDKCYKCRPCFDSVGSNCDSGETCVNQSQCQNYQDCASVTKVNVSDACPDGYYWDSDQQSCEVAFGYCNNIFANQCYGCKPCASEGGCGSSEYGTTACGWALCENYKFCNAQLALSEPKNNPHNCSSNMYWDEQAQHCLSGKGWCNPPSGMYKSCSDCIAVNAGYEQFQNVCPQNWNVQDFVYCEQQGTYCGGFPKCNIDQWFNNSTFACQNLQGWCKPKDNSWLYEECSQCTSCPSSGTCPGNTECVSDINCQDFKTLCTDQKKISQ